MSGTRSPKHRPRTCALMMLTGLGLTGVGLLAVGPNLPGETVMIASSQHAGDVPQAPPQAAGKPKKLAMVPVDMFADRSDTSLDLWEAFTQSFIEGSRLTNEMYDWHAMLSNDPQMDDLRKRMLALAIRVDSEQIRPSTTALLDFRVHDIGAKRGDVPETDPDEGAYWQLYRLITQRRNETADAFQLLKNEALRARGRYVSREKSDEIAEMFRERPD